MTLSHVRLASLLFVGVLAVVAIPVEGQKATQTEPAKAIATFATGWTYLWADQGNHYRSNLNGWFVRPTVLLPRGYAVFFSNTNYYGTNAKGGVGLSIPIRSWVSLAITPAEYVFLYPHSDWRNDYNGKLGLSFPIGHP